MDLTILNEESLKKRLNSLLANLDGVKAQNLKIDMTRGKPSKEQLLISEEMLYNISSSTDLTFTDNNSILDVRNYGCLTGLPELKKIFSSVLDVECEQIIIGGNASLALIYDIISKAFIFGLKNSEKPWSKLEKIKFLCPVPGYDRHFSMCESFGIEMINIDMDENGVNIEQVKKYVESDDSIKGMWCVPKYSNPTGIVYSDEVITELANLKPKAKDFTIFYDNAYFLHSLFNNDNELLNIFSLLEGKENEDMVIGFASTSKITNAGGGVSLIYSSKGNVDYIKGLMKYQTIGYDKINQLRHSLFLKNESNLKSIMKKHSDIMSPKFNAVIDEINVAKKNGLIANYIVPKGGYFISFNTMSGCAKRVVEICKSVGVSLTPAGATYPYKKDFDDSNIRIAPSFIGLNDAKKATNVMMLAVEIAQIEKMVSEHCQ